MKSAICGIEIVHENQSCEGIFWIMLILVQKSIYIWYKVKTIKQFKIF